MQNWYLNLAQKCACFDLPLGCSALPYGMSVACSYLLNPHMHKVALLCGDAQWPNYASVEEIKQSETFLMGEAVGCMLLARESQGTDWHISLFSEGHGYKHLCHFASGIKNSWRKAGKYILPNGEKYVAGNYMDGLEISMFAAGTVAKSLQQFWQQNHTIPSCYDALILHQANAQIIKGIKKSLQLSEEVKIPLSISKYGNTSAASSLVTICDAFGADKDAHELRLCNAAFGIGLSWGFSDFYLNTQLVDPIFSTDMVLSEHFLKPDTANV